MKKYIQEHKYVLLVLYLPIYLIWFALVERMVPSTEGCFVSYLPLDDKIPFLPGFILAYVLWYPFLIVPVVVTLLKDDRRAFIRYAAFIIAGFSISLTICMIWPNCQLLRPSVVDTSTLCGWLVNAIYSADTPTNVLPSMHVVGCMAVLAVTFDSKYLKKGAHPGGHHRRCDLRGDGVCQAALHSGRVCGARAVAGAVPDHLCRGAPDRGPASADGHSLRETKQRNR